MDYRFWLVTVFIVSIVLGCIEAPMEDGSERQAGDRDSPASGFADIGEPETVDLNDGRGDVDLGGPTEPREENPWPNGRDTPPPDLPDAGGERDTGHDENGRTAEDIANREDLG